MIHRGGEGDDPQPSEPEDVSRAILGMCSVIRGLLAGATRDEVLTRRQVGEVVLKMRSMPHAYGKQCVERIAAEVGVAATTLYRCVAVAECWTTKQLTEHLERTNRFGQPLSWSHLVVLSTAPDAVAREVLFEECLSNAWGVRELKQHLERVRWRTRDAEPGSAADAVHAALRDGIQLGVQATAEIEAFESRFAAQLVAADTPPDAELIARAIATIEALKERAASALAQLRVATVSEKRLRAAPPSEPEPGDDDEAYDVVDARKARRRSL
jgi:hypothetical protein